MVFNNADVQLISAIDELKVDEWQRQIDLNVTGVMNVIAAFLPHLTAAAERGDAADLINTSSIAATRILEKFSIYSGTKAYISHVTSGRARWRSGADTPPSPAPERRRGLGGGQCRPAAGGTSPSRTAGRRGAVQPVITLRQTSEMVALARPRSPSGAQEAR